ncbi:MAG: GreA/GreB family elongation factor [Chloroflexota bacterium]
MGQALLNKKVGDDVAVQAPGGNLRFLITQIE